MNNVYSDVITVELSDFCQNYNVEDYEVLDEEKNKWCEYKDSCYAPTNEFPFPDLAKYPINLITLYFSKTGHQYTLGNQDYTGDNPAVKNYMFIPDEKRMMERFVDIFRKEKPDFHTGWNTHTFDVPYIVNRCKKLGVDYTRMSPLNHVEANKHGEYVIAGVADLDYILLYKKFTFDKKDSYTLQAIGELEVGEGKLDYEGTLYDAYKTDWNNFVEYNVQDVLLVVKIEAEKKFIELVVDICYQSLIPFDRILSTIAMHTGYIMGYLHKNNIVMPPRAESDGFEVPGAHVYAKPGFYEYCISYDVASLYPFEIMTYNIGPETLRLYPTDTTGLIRTPLSESDGIWYDGSKQSVLSQVVEEIFNDRVQFKNKMKICEQIDSGVSEDDHKTLASRIKISEKEIKQLIEEVAKEKGSDKYYNSQQHIRKIMINSLYGACANQYFHFYNPHNAKCITQSGVDLIKYLSSAFNDYFKNYFWKNKKYFTITDEKNKIENDVCVLIDTDSTYICLKEVIEKLGLKFNTNEEFRQWAVKFSEEFFQPIIEQILNAYADQYGTKQLIDFKREKIISQMMIVAKKHYVTEILDTEGTVHHEPKFKVTGIEIVKTSTPKFIRSELKKFLIDIFKHRGSIESKDELVDKLRTIHKKFDVALISDIAKPMGISDYDKYGKSGSYYVEHGINYPHKCPPQHKSAINYNYIIALKNLNLMPISNGTKMKFVPVKKTNQWRFDRIAFINQWPKEFDEWFEVDHKALWDSVAQNLIQGWFNVLKWGTANTQTCKLKDLWRKKKI